MTKYFSISKAFLAGIILSTIFISEAFSAAIVNDSNQSKIVNDDTDSMHVDAGKAQVIALPRPVSRVAVGDPRVLDYILINPKQLYVIGKTVGTTNIILWYTNDSFETKNIEVSYDLSYLRKTIKRDLPGEEDIKIEATSGTIVLSGSVSSTLAAGTLVNIAEAYLRNIGRSSANNNQNTGGNNNQFSAQQNSQVSSSFVGRGGDFSVNILNLVKIRDPQQVMLEVKIASVNKTLLNQLGMKLGATKAGSFNYSVLSARGGMPAANDAGVVTNSLGNLVPGTVDLTTAAIPTSTASFLNIILGDKNGLTKLGLSADKADTMVRVLAEPNIVTLSGQEGRFLKGGKIFIPVPQSSGAAGSTITLEEKEFGVGVRFLPTVLDGGRINLKVSPEVSNLSSTAISASAGTGMTNFPSFETKSVSTNVQLNNGEMLVIGGLLDDQTIATLSGVPGLSQIPFFGALFRNTTLSKDKTELIIVVKASLVKASQERPVLPTDNTVSPTASDVLINGTLEGSKPVAKSETSGSDPVEQTTSTDQKSISNIENTVVESSSEGKPTNLVDLLKRKSKE